MNLIEVNALLAEIEEEIENEKSYDDYDRGIIAGLRIAYKDIKNRPKVEAEPIKHGQWIAIRNGTMKHWKEQCSVCKGITRGRYPYCRSCGARMDGDVNEL